MKQKINNRILSVFNILGWITYLSLKAFENINVKVEWSKLAVMYQQKELVTLSDTFFIVLLSINIFFMIKNIKNKKVIPWYIVVSIFYFIGMLSIFLMQVFERTEDLWRYIPIIPFIVVLIIELIRKRRIKNIIIYCIAIVGCILLAVINQYNNFIWLIIASIMQFIFSEDKEDESKIQKAFNTTILAIVAVSMIYFVIRYVMLLNAIKDVDNESLEFCNKITSSVQNLDIKEDLVRASRDGKWGYINKDGKEIIPCEYDEISNNATTHLYVLAKKEDTYYIIDKNGNTIITYNNVPAPFYKGAMLRQLKVNPKVTNDNPLTRALESISSYVGEKKVTTTEEEKTNILKPEKINENNSYEYKLENNNTVLIETVKQNSETKYNVTVKTPENEIINKYENVSLYLTKGNLDIYTSGDIPYYDFDNNTQGIYTKDNFEDIKIKGSYQILDVIEDKIIIRNYSVNNNITELIITKNGQILLTAKEINASNNGYIVKKSNGKMVYLDKDLNEKTKEFDFINDYYYSKGRLICSNNSEGYSIYDLEGNLVTNLKYETIDIEEPLKEGSVKEYLTDVVYENSYNK